MKKNYQSQNHDGKFGDERINTIMNQCDEQRFNGNIESLATIGCMNNAEDICIAIEFLFDLKRVVNHFREERDIK